jgi:hypothetical protein
VAYTHEFTFYTVVEKGKCQGKLLLNYNTITKLSVHVDATRIIYLRPRSEMQKCLPRVILPITCVRKWSVTRARHRIAPYDEVRQQWNRQARPIC